MTYQYRNRWLAAPEHMTPVGRWIADRLPHIDHAKDIWGIKGSRVWRLYGFKPLCRCCLIDYTYAPGLRCELRILWLRISLRGAA
jgi:hypothetical protein